MNKIFVDIHTADLGLGDSVKPVLVVLDERLLIVGGDSSLLRAAALAQTVHASVGGAAEVHMAIDGGSILDRELIPLVVEAPLHVTDAILLAQHLRKGVTVTEPGSLQDNNWRLCGAVSEGLVDCFNSAQYAEGLEGKGVALQICVELLKEVVLATYLLPPIYRLLHNNPRGLASLDKLKQRALTGSDRSLNGYHNWARTAVDHWSSDVAFVGEISPEGSVFHSVLRDFA